MAGKSFAKKSAFFLVKFFAIYAVLQAAILAAPLQPLESSIAAMEAGLLGEKSEGNIVFIGENRAEIASSCTGLLGISVLASIIFSLKKPNLKKKAGLLAIGAAILFPLNIARVYLVLASGRAFGFGFLETMHVATWFVMSAAILGIWYWLTKKTAGTKGFEELI